jgi:hypothetical protein
VLNYNLDRQLQLASRMGETSRHVGGRWFDGRPFSLAKLWPATVAFVKQLGFIILGVAMLTLLGLLFGRDVWRWWKTRQRVLKLQRGEAEASDATLLYQRMLKVLTRRGFERPNWLTPLEFARVLQDPDLSLLVEDLTEAYNQLRFGGNSEAAPRLMQLLERLEAIP